MSRIFGIVREVNAVSRNVASRFGEKSPSLGRFIAPLVQFPYPKGGGTSPKVARLRQPLPLHSIRGVIFPTFPRIQEQQLGFISQTGGADFNGAVHIAKCRGLSFVGMCGGARTAGLGKGRGVAKRF